MITAFYYLYYLSCELGKQLKTKANSGEAFFSWPFSGEACPIGDARQEELSLSHGWTCLGRTMGFSGNHHHHHHHQDLPPPPRCPHHQDHYNARQVAEYGAINMTGLRIVQYGSQLARDVFPRYNM